MTARLPYLFNILVLVPVATMTLFFGASGVQRVFQGRFSDSPGIRMILGSVWMALLIASCLGLFFPTSLAAILLVQVLYKSLWLALFALPRLLAQRSHEVPPGVALTFAFIVMTYPLAMDWTKLLGGE